MRRKIGKNVEASCHRLIKELPWNFSDNREKITETHEENWDSPETTTWESRLWIECVVVRRTFLELLLLHLTTYTILSHNKRVRLTNTRRTSWLSRISSEWVFIEVFKLLTGLLLWQTSACFSNVSYRFDFCCIYLADTEWATHYVGISWYLRFSIEVFRLLFIVPTRWHTDLKDFMARFFYEWLITTDGAKKNIHKNVMITRSSSAIYELFQRRVQQDFLLQTLQITCQKKRCDMFVREYWGMYTMLLEMIEV